MKIKNLHRSGSKAGIRVSRNWVIVRKKILLSKWTPVLNPLCQTFPFWWRHSMTKTRYILWSEMNGLLNQLSFFGHILFLQVTIDALNSLKNFLRIGSSWFCRQPRKSWTSWFLLTLTARSLEFEWWKIFFFLFLVH